MSRSDDYLIELLCLWWRLEREYLPVEGYPVECPSCAGYIASRQYDDANGAQETDARGREARHVGWVVSTIEEPHRTALHMLARNRVTGVSVWSSPRIPPGQAEQITREALDLFADALA